MHPFRVFVSYSHEDRSLAEQAVKVLRKIGLEPIWDQDIRPGAPFSDAIRGLISHAHIFMPIITKNSQERPWVHQETGYAMAINIPVLPIAVSTLPQEMTAQLQAIIVKEDFSDLFERLQEVNIEQVVIPPPDRPASIVEVADWPETRTELIAQYANRVVELRAYGYLRHRGALSSFCLPDKDVNDPVWKRRDGEKLRSHYYHMLQREERRALEVHARARGCSLIIDPSIHFDITKLGPLAIKTRLETLLEFLQSIPDEQSKPDPLVRVVISPRARGANTLIVGDWFVAESMVPRRAKAIARRSLVGTRRPYCGRLASSIRNSRNSTERVVLKRMPRANTRYPRSRRSSGSCQPAKPNAIPRMSRRHQLWLPGRLPLHDLSILPAHHSS